ncbi:MAG: hypothetical protein AAFR56_11785 [Chloroflexota bacterium]
MTQPDILQRLHSIYAPHGAPPYKRGGSSYPFHLAHTDANPAHINDVLSLEPPYRPLNRDSVFIYDADAVADVQAAGRRVYNGITFTFERLEQDPLRLYATLGGYFDHIGACIPLENELTTGGDTPLRDRLHSVTPPDRLLYSGRGRGVAIGMGTLTVYKHTDGDYRALIIRRSANTAHKPGAFHVVPAFILQPSGVDYPASEWSLTTQIKREYLEELFNVQEQENGGADYEAIPAAQQYDAMLADGRAELHFTGFSLNLLTTQVSVCSLLLIHDETWHRQPMGDTWESGGLYSLSIATDEAVLAAIPGDMAQMTPNGAASLWCGVDRARRIVHHTDR